VAMDLEGAIQTFAEEAHELLTAMEEGLLALDTDPANAEHLSTVFRAAHTIKGSGGLFGFDPVVDFTHRVESLLDHVRAGGRLLDDAGIALLLRCRDHIATLVEAAIHNRPLTPETRAVDEDLRRGLAAWGGQTVTQSAPAGGPVTPPRSEGPAPAGGDYNWHISLRLAPGVLKSGIDPMGFLRYLRTIGCITHLTTLCDGIPEATAMDPELCYLGFEINYRSTASKAEIEEVFEFLSDDCFLRILPQYSKVNEYVALIDELPESSFRLGEILVASGAVTAAELAHCLARQKEGGQSAARADGTPSAQALGEVLVREGAADPAIVGAAIEKQQRIRADQGGETRTLRVDAEKLDHLIDLVGELVIASDSIWMRSRRLCGEIGTGTEARTEAGEDLIEASNGLARLVEEIRDGALKLRMVQIGATFQRFQRVARDVSREFGKEIALRISGAETELDKALVERLADPLLHLVRNSIDHGIETVAERLQTGKPPQGTLELNAFHDAGNIVIEVADDGRGLDPERILRKARERGLVPEGHILSEAEILDLVFEPGFSTADQISDLSGRGVGMDVVRRGIEALRGTVELTSKKDKGTLVRLRLPLTLAIISGFLVGLRGANYIIPLDLLVECLELTPDLRAMARAKGYVALRGEVLPCLWLADCLGLVQSARQGSAHGNAHENLVVVQTAGGKVCLVVDELHGELETVIKPLGRIFQSMQGIRGATLLGSGEVALILDVNGVAALAGTRTGARPAALALAAP